MQRTEDSPARILVVDEPIFGSVTANLLRSTPEWVCVGLAGDANASVHLLEQAQPDAVVLGISPPATESLDVLGRLLAVRPTRVLALSADNRESAELTIEALQCGVLDFVVRPNRPELCDFRLRDELRARLRGLLACNLEAHLSAKAIDRRSSTAAAQPRAEFALHDAPNSSLADAQQRIVVVGAGTGGPRALLHMFRQLRAPLPPIVIAQHLPTDFVHAIALQLEGLSPIRCKVAESGDALQPNTAYLAPAGRQTVVIRRNGQSTLLVHADVSPSTRQPAPRADVLMQSAAMAYGSKCLGVLLSGNGRDGVEGARAIGVMGGFVLGQDARSSYSHGTNQIALGLNYIDRQFHLDDAAEALRTVTPFLGRPEISVVRSPVVDPGPLHAIAT